MTASAAASPRRGRAAAGDLIACPDCDTRQYLPPLAAGSVATCIACHAVLERTHGRSLDAALACSAATLLLLIPGNLLTFLRTEALGVSRHSVVASAAGAMLRDGWPVLALVVLFFAVIFPLARFSLLTVVLGHLRLGRRPPWLGRAFRYACALETWAMADVYLLGLGVAYARLAASIAVHLGGGAYCYIAAGILSLFVRATMSKSAVWRRIEPDRSLPDDADTVECDVCGQGHPLHCAGSACSRCGARLATRLPDSIPRTIALTLAGVVLYIPANLYPIATLPINLRPLQYTVIEGVIDLVKAGLLPLALLVFTASFAIPILKLAGLGWCVVSVLRRSDRHLVGKTRVYRAVEEVGRWSMVDPFVIGCFVPVMHYNQLIYGRAEPAAVPFTAVVVLTIVGAKFFDPRLMWDAARRRA